VTSKRRCGSPNGVAAITLLVIIHCTKKLAQKVAGVSAVALREAHPLQTWHGHLYRVDRRQCVLFCHDETRFVLFLPGVRKEHLADLGTAFRHLFTGALAAFGCSEARVGRALLAPDVDTPSLDLAGQADARDRRDPLAPQVRRPRARRTHCGVSASSSDCAVSRRSPIASSSSMVAVDRRSVASGGSGPKRCVSRRCSRAARPSARPSPI
jgi:hypothetical protein